GPDPAVTRARRSRSAGPRVRGEVPHLHHQRGHPPPRSDLRRPPARRRIVSAPDTSATAGGPAATAVTATLTCPLRGSDMVETFTVIRGELGAPHLSVLPVLG